MSRFKSIFACALLILTFAAGATMAAAQDKSTGGIKGRVRVETGKPSEVAVIVRQGEREVTQSQTNSKGEFTVNGLQPGIYSVTFRKPGLQVGTMTNVEVRAGKVKTLGDRLVLSVDEGSIAKVRGSVFSEGGRSIGGVRVEIARIQEDGSLKKLGDRITTETGMFVFRLPPDRAKYRITVKADGAAPASKDIVVDDAVVYSVALTLEPAQK